jgi:hypothetical protein
MVTLPQKNWRLRVKLTELIHTILVVKNNYPMAKYSRSKILMDTKNILHQKFAKKYC